MVKVRGKEEDRMEEKKIDRLLFWDILKGIGIVSIVFGHSQNLGIAIRTVYYYHLAIFFFISGYFYNEERYGDAPFDFFARRLKNMWVPYFCYGACSFYYITCFQSICFFCLMRTTAKRR